MKGFIAGILLAFVSTVFAQTEYNVEINPPAPDGVEANLIAGYETTLSCENNYTHTIYNFGASPLPHVYSVAVAPSDGSPVCTGTAAWFDFAADYAPRESLSVQLAGPSVPLTGTTINIQYSPHVINDLKMSCQAQVECTVAGE